MRNLLYISLLSLLTACNTEKTADTLFKQLPPNQTGIDFNNQLEYTEEFNPYIYRNFYNGAGVVLGDINNDGLVDIYFCGNLENNKLYLNKGSFKFEDITKTAGVACSNIWSSGASMADVNGDGWLDIYVCKSGSPGGKNRHNELFINNANPDTLGRVTFTEQAKTYGIADEGLSVHAVFFDYDKDGDLDCYLLNNSIRSVGNYDFIKDQRNIRDTLGGNKLYQNNTTKEGQVLFTDVSKEAGIYGSAIGFGLGVTIGDVNRDGWQDIFVSNDFFERDYLYINNLGNPKAGQTTFTESLEQQMGEISMGSMGADMADLNNDGLPEIYVTDMLPRDEARLKTKMTFENWDKYQLKVQTGYHHQFTRNVLQLNNGISPKGHLSFSEIGRLADVHATDWSWGALIMDMDNDGFKDIFVANGIYKDLLDQDYTHFFGDQNRIRRGIQNKEKVLTKLFDAIPSSPLSNYAFQNNLDLDSTKTNQIPTFTNKAKAWGLGTPSFSNGSAYGDLDNDGDLDLVVNNVNMPAFVYRNDATKLSKNHYLQFSLKGIDKNPFALGTQITIKHQGTTYYQELAPMRGFQSAVDYCLHFGLGSLKMVDSVIVQWSNDTQTILTKVTTNQRLTLKQTNANHKNWLPFLPPSTPLLQNITASTIQHQHQENTFNDFNRDRLLHQMISAEGPKIAVGDINLNIDASGEDFFITGAKNQASKLYIQLPNGQFKSTNEALFEKDKLSEDVDALFFDADGDKDLDLCVVTGSNEFSPSSGALLDRLYINTGKNNFTKSPQGIPTGFSNASCVKAADYDQDGDLDLFVGTRLRSFLYGVPASSFLLNNNGKGQFQNVTVQHAPQLENLGMVTDAIWADIDQDNDQDLIVIGDWMPITIFKNEQGKLTKLPNDVALPKNTNGWWNTIEAGDFDKDGDLDFVIGNHGLNTRLKANPQQPITLYINDFDSNGSAEHILTTYNRNAAYPLVLRHDLIKQLPYLKKKYLKYNDYKNQTIQDIFTSKAMEQTVQQTVNQTQTILLLNESSKSNPIQFSIKSLPMVAQLAPVHSILVTDINKDNNLDILLGGNFYRSKPEIGIYNASYGLCLIGNGQGTFTTLKASQSGFFVKGEIRDIVTLNGKNGQRILVGRNNDYLQVFE